jgi:hypothetical protein
VRSIELGPDIYCTYQLASLSCGSWWWLLPGHGSSSQKTTHGSGRTGVVVVWLRREARAGPAVHRHLSAEGYPMFGC